jgi:cytochrome P450 / NADPH-cytochrome P450 reductase
MFVVAHAQAAPIPMPPKVPLFGHALAIDAQNSTQSLIRLVREHGPLTQIVLPGKRFVVVSSHELAAEVFDDDRFEKLVFAVLEHIREFAGDGLFTAHQHEPNWQKAHNILLPAFGMAAMREYHSMMGDIALQMVDRWDRLNPGEAVDIVDQMTRLTLDTIALCGFGYRLNSFYQREMHLFIESMLRCLCEANERTNRLTVENYLRALVDTPYRRDIAFINQLVDRIIAERKAHGRSEGQPRDLLELMLEGVDKATGERLDDINIRYQIVTFLIAGHETTSAMLSFALHYLTQHPDLLEKAQREVDRVLGADREARPSFAQIGELRYVQQVLKESLRLWPPAPAFTLTPKQDTLLGGRWAVRKGDALLVLTPALHRDPAAWGADAERFDPDRFTPEAEARRPATAFKPFGHGPRACIGRQFAMHEASLALALVLHRFDPIPQPGYTLRIRETPALKPDGLFLQMRRRRPSDEAPRPARLEAPRPARLEAPPAPSPHAHGTPLLVLYGSNMGSAEALARKVAAAGEQRGYAARVAPLDSCEGGLSGEGVIVIVCASYNGKPPDNAARFCRWLEGVQARQLEGVRYGVFGCGNRDWASTFQAVPRWIDQRMVEAGATRLFERGEADASGGDFFGSFADWDEQLWPTLSARLGLPDAPAAPAGPAWTLAVVDDAVSSPLISELGAGLATVVENRELADTSDPQARSKRHIVLSLPEGMSYRAGDLLGIIPENAPELVERVCRRFGVPADARVVLRPNRAVPTALPLDRPVRLDALLSRLVEIQEPATRAQVALLAEHTRCPPEKKTLAALATPEAYEAEVLKKRRSLLDLLELAPACELPLGSFLEQLPPLRPRFYSISSSPLASPATCSLTVGVVHGPTRSGSGVFQGVASSRLARLVAGDRLPVFVRAPNTPLRLPEDTRVPVLMICAGTGIAPFHGFLQERAALAARGASLGPAALFFGCRHPEIDYLYREELLSWEQAGIARVVPAFSMLDPERKVYVQHRLLEEAESVWALIEAGGRIYLCGDGARMAPAVRQAIARIFMERTGSGVEAAEAWLGELEREGRYVADVWSGG